MPIKKPIQVHRECRGGEAEPEFIGICRDAEAAGLTSISVPIHGSLEDAFSHVQAAAQQTSRLQFRIAEDLSCILATLRGVDLQALAESLPGRIILHVRFPDLTASDHGNMIQASEFLANCRSLFPKGSGPRFEVEGQGTAAAFLAIKYGDCLWRRHVPLNQFYADALPVLHFGKDVGVLVSLQEDAFSGSCQEVAEQIWNFQRRGISQFLIQEAGELDERLCAIVRSQPALEVN